MIASLIGIPGKMKTLLDRITSGRAANLDNLNATISSRAAASTALSNAVWTDALAARVGHATNRCQYFTASGTWTKPDGVEWIYVIMWGGGGGGAGGRAATGTNTFVEGAAGQNGQGTSISASSLIARGGLGGVRGQDGVPNGGQTTNQTIPIVFASVRGGFGGGDVYTTAGDGQPNEALLYVSGFSSGAGGGLYGGGGGGGGYNGNGTSGSAGSNSSVWSDAAHAAANSGAGGGGGGGVANVGVGSRHGGGGGSGGQLVILERVRVTGNVTVTVGNGGAGGAGGNNGTFRGGNGGNGGSGGCIIFW